MKITQCRNGGRRQTQRTLELAAGLDAMRTEIKSQPITGMRQTLPFLRPGEKGEAVQRVPLMIFGCALRRTSGGIQEMDYNGCITLEVNRLTGRKEAAEVRKAASELPQTQIAFVGSSNRSVKIIVPFTLPDGTLPQTQETIERFHAQAYREAVKWYQPQLNREIDLKKPTPDQAVRMTLDPNLYYNPDAVPIRLEQPTRMPAEPTYEEKRQAIADPLQRLLPGYERQHLIATLFDTSLNNAIIQLNGVEWSADLQPFFVRLAENCFYSGIPQEDAVRWTLLHSDLMRYEVEIRTNFRNVYALKKKFGSKPCIPSSMTLVARLDEFMKRRYEFRYNTMKSTVEYRELKSFQFDFRPITSRAMNSISLHAQYEGLPAWDPDIKRYVESDWVAPYNPVEEYLYRLREWDGTDRIRAVADRVKCAQPDKWRERFHRWFLSMVAHWQGIDKQHANSSMPLLIGDQGCGKSTYCAMLLPPQLRDYFTDSIDFSNKRSTELALNRYLLVNLDEFDSISPAYQGYMKHIVQKSVVQSRRPYQRATEAMRRYATFIATSNNFDLLSDPTGSRRFICMEVQGIIDYTQPIDYEQLYAQAVAEIRSGEPYWFTHDEEAQMTNDNQRFQRTCLEEETCFLYFREPTSGEAYEELTCVEILERIKARQKGFKYTNKTVLQLGRILAARLKSRRAHRGTIYKVVEIK